MTFGLENCIGPLEIIGNVYLVLSYFLRLKCDILYLEIYNIYISNTYIQNCYLKMKY